MKNFAYSFRAIAFTACLLTSVGAFAQQSISANGEAVALKQNTAYTIKDATDKYINPSWFTANNDGTYTFKAIDGNYVLIDHGSLNYIEVRTTDKDGNDLTLQSDGTGALYLVGSQIGLPSTSENPQAFITSDLRKMISMAPVKAGVYEITLLAGEQIGSGATGFYADKTNRLTGSGTYKVTSSSGPIVMNTSDGNLNAPSQAPYRSTIVLTVDCSNGSSAITVKSTLTYPAKPISLTFNGKKMTNPGYDYYYTGTFTQGADYKVTGADVINGDDWYYDVDYFSKNADGSFKFLPITGTYTVRANFATRSFQVYPSEADGTAGSYNVEDGTGAIWIRGNRWIYKPSYHFASAFYEGLGNLNASLAMAPIEKNKWQLTLRLGKEVSPSANTYMNDRNNCYYFRIYGFLDKSNGVVFGNEVNQWFKAAYTISDKNDFIPGPSKVQNIRIMKKFEEGKTYRIILDTSDPKNAKLSLEVTDTPTNIRSITTHESVNDNAIYNLAGQRVDSSYKGVVIRGGKKMINR